MIILIFKPSGWLGQSLAVVALFAVVKFSVAAPPPEFMNPEHPSTVKERLRRVEPQDALIAGFQQRTKTLEWQATAMAAESDDGRAASAYSSPFLADAQVPAEHPAADGGDEDEDLAAEKEEASVAPGQFEVDEKAAERALERALVLEGALLVPFRQAEIQPGFTYIRNERGFPVVFTDELGQQFISEQSSFTDIFVGDLTLRLGLPFQSQLEVGVPYQYIEQQEVTSIGGATAAESRASASGLGDLRVGLAKGLLRESRWLPNLIGRVTYTTNEFNSATERDILFSGFSSIGGSLTAIKSQDPLVFIGNISYESFFEENSLELGDSLSFSVGALLAASPETSLRLTLDQTFMDKVKIEGRAIEGTERTIGIMNFGASSIVGRGLFLDFQAGIGVSGAAPDYLVGIALIKRFGVPGLL
jgi:hypothetical protein